jgi:hypothetical protein
MWRCVDASTCSPLPSSGYRGRPLREPCGSPPSSVLWVRKTARLPVAAASGLPWQQVSARRGFVRFPQGVPSSPGTWSSLGWAGPAPNMRQRQGALLGSQEVPMETCPVLETPATPSQPRVAVVRMLPCTLSTVSASQRWTISELNSSRPASSLCTLRTRQSPDEWQHSLPACPLRL